MSVRNGLFSSESVSEGHPDKLADRISDAVLDEFLRLEPAARVACETLLADQCVVVAGEFKTRDPGVFRQMRERAAPIVAGVLRDAGYRDGATGIDPERCEVQVRFNGQSADITRGVATDMKAPLIDLRKACVAHLAEHNTANAKEGILTTDGVHLTPAGDQFLAARMVAGLTAAGLVSAGIPQETEKMLRHVVMFKFKETSTEADVARIVKAFGALPERIKEIKGFEWGTDNSPEGLQQGLTHCFFVTFDSEADRDAYLPHPAHKEFVDLVGPHVEKVTVVDYWAKP